MFGPWKKTSQTAPEQKDTHWWDALAPVIETASGLDMSPAAALRNPTVYACVRVISETVAQLPLNLFERLSDESREKATGNALHDLLRWQANDWTSAAEFRITMMMDALSRGRGYAFINRDRNGEPVELIHLPAGHVTRDQSNASAPPIYKVRGTDNTERVYSVDQILEIAAPGGLAPIAQCREAIALSTALERHAANLMKRGARPSGTLETDDALTPKALESLRKAMESITSGHKNSMGLLPLDKGMKFNQLTFNSVDMQFQEMRRFQIGEISRAFRVPLTLINDLEKATLNNAETLGRQFLTYTIQPWLETWQQAIRARLIRRDQRETLYAEFDTNLLAKADMAARWDAYTKAVSNGLLNPNEVRSRENLPHYAGGEAFMRPLNMGAATEADDGNDNL